MTFYLSSSNSVIRDKAKDVSLGKALHSPSLVLIKLRKDMNNVSSSHDINQWRRTPFNQSLLFALSADARIQAILAQSLAASQASSDDSQSDSLMSSQVSWSSPWQPPYQLVTQVGLYDNTELSMSFFSLAVVFGPHWTGFIYLNVGMNELKAWLDSKKKKSFCCMTC